MQDLAADAEHNPADEHDRPLVPIASKAVYRLADHAEHRSDYEHDAGALRVDEDAAEQGHDHIGEGIQGIEQVELGLADGVFRVFLVVVLLDGSLQGLSEGMGTLGVSKQYSQPNTTRQAMTTMKYLSLVRR